MSNDDLTFDAVAMPGSRIRTLAVGAAVAFLLFAATPAAWAFEPPPGDSRTEVGNGHGDQHEAGHGAGHGEHHGFDAKAYGFQALNFAILVFILVKFGGGAINKMLAARREQLKVDLEDAARARAAAEERLKLQETRLAGLEQELTALRASLKQEAEDEKRRLVDAAEERVRRIQNETTFLLEQQVKEAERRFREEVATAALQIAETEIRRAIQPADEQRLVGNFVGELDRTAATAGRAV